MSPAPRPATLPPRIAGHVGLWACAAVLALCLVLVWTGVGGLGPQAEADAPDAGARICQGLLFGLVAALGIWLFVDFLKLPDWTLAPEVPSGVKLLGHLGRVLGSLAAAACIALVALTVVFPDHVPPVRPRPKRPSAEAVLEKLDATGSVPAADNAAGAGKTTGRLGQARPGLAALYVLCIFVSLLVRVVGSAISELRTWARVGSIAAAGAALALLLVAFVLSFTAWRDAGAQVALGLFAGGTLALFIFLLVYFMLPGVVDAFEARRL